MKNTKYTSALLSLLVCLSVFTACKKKADMPPVNPVGDVMTIQQLRDLFLSNGCNTYKFTKDVSLYAYVTMDATSGNIYKMVYLRDSLGGCISMKQLSAGGLFEGDYLRINLNGAYLDKASSGSFLQIDSVDVNSPQNKVIKLAVGKNQSPVAVTIPQLLNSVTTNSCAMAQSIYDGQLIQLNNVEFAVGDTGKYYNNLPSGAPASVTHVITDCGAMNSINAYTSSYATEFLMKKTPGGSGSLVAIASFYSGVMQLTLHSIPEITMSQPRCGVDTLTQSFGACISGSNFSTAIPGWYNLPQVGYLTWQGGPPASPPGYPTASNFGSSTTRNVMWLISPPINSSSTKNVNFQTGTNYGTTTHPKQLSVLVSTDFNGNNLTGTNAATWYDITTSFPNIQNGSMASYFFTDASTAPVTLSQIPALSFLSSYTGTFYLGFRYTAHLSTDSTQTFAIKNLTIKN